MDISHEMLIVGWPSSREWVESRRNAEKTRRRLVAKAEEWARLGRRESGLLDPAELAEADTWLKGPDAVDLGIDADVNALAEASRRAIEFAEASQTAVDAACRRRIDRRSDRHLLGRLLGRAQAARGGDRKSRREKNADEAKANAAEVLIEAGSTALANGHSFDAMHHFARAIGTLPGKSPHRAEVRQGLGFLVREGPRSGAFPMCRPSWKRAACRSNPKSVISEY